MTDLAALKAANSARWAKAKVTRRPDFVFAAKRLIAPAAKARYQFVEAKTDVPWAVIAVIHEREAAQRWDRQLGQGDPLNEVSTHVPNGRGPFLSWEESAIDALVNCAPHAARNKDWSIGGTLTKLEEYNGLGYAAHGVPSPYIWSGTNQYVSGKYIRDGVYDPGKVDEQLGCAGLLMAMMALDPSISFGRPPAIIVQMPSKPVKPTDLNEKDNAPNIGPVAPPPSFATAFARLFAFILSLFKPKGK